MKKIKVDTIIFDFDSTILDGELLEILAEIKLKNHPLRKTILNQISEVTNMGMEGTIPFEESLDRRLRLLNLSQSILDESLLTIKNRINKQYLNILPKINDKNIHIISGGYKNIIDKLSAEVGVPEEKIHAIDLIFNNGEFSHFDKNNPLINSDGKAKVAKSLSDKGTTIMIGDGMTDYLVKEYGGADYFVAYTGIVKRAKVCSKADVIIEDMNDIMSYIE